MARCLDPKGRDGRLLAKKIKEHIAESQSRKQEEGRKICCLGDKVLADEASKVLLAYLIETSFNNGG